MDGWIKHKVAFLIPVGEDPIPSDLKPYIPVMLDDQRDRLADERFGPGGWKPGELTIDWKVQSIESGYDDEGEWHQFTMHHIMARGFVWGPEDPDYDYGQKTWGLSE